MPTASNSKRRHACGTSVRAIEKTVERQTVLHHWGIDQDVFGLYREGGFIEAIVLMVRGGKLTNTQDGVSRISNSPTRTSSPIF